MEILELTVEQEGEDRRLDQFLADYLEGYSRSWLQKLIRSGNIRVNAREIKPNYRCEPGDLIRIEIPDPEKADIRPEAMDLDILYEDSDLIFINKPKGMVVHPAPGHFSGTLVNGLMYHCGEELSGINGVMRPGIVHRIDMDTTGVIVACKNDFSHNHVAAQLADHSITRQYTAVVHGVIREDSGTVSQPIARSQVNRLKMAVDPVRGRPAVTHYHVEKRFRSHTCVTCRLETGRTHQIRVHMTYIHHPLLGDTVYGNIPSGYHLQGQTLHAGVLGLIHPRTGQYLEIRAPLPEYFEKLLRIIPE